MRRKERNHVVEVVDRASFNALISMLHLCQEHYRLMLHNPSMELTAKTMLARLDDVLLVACEQFDSLPDGKVRIALTPTELGLIARCTGVMEAGGLRDVKRKRDEYDCDYYMALSAICSRREAPRRALRKDARRAREERSRKLLLPAYAAHVGERVTKEQMREETGLAAADFQKPYRQLVEGGWIVMDGRLVVSVTEPDEGWEPSSDVEVTIDDLVDDPVEDGREEATDKTEVA